jgi:hypothetical protein
MKQRLLLITLSIIGFTGVALSILWLIPLIVFSPSGTRAWKILVAYDMLGNATTGGDVGETISTRAYKASLVGNKYGCWLCKFLDYLKPNHCKDSIK